MKRMIMGAVLLVASMPVIGHPENMSLQEVYDVVQEEVQQIQDEMNKTQFARLDLLPSTALADACDDFKDKVTTEEKIFETLISTLKSGSNGKASVDALRAASKAASAERLQAEIELMRPLEGSDIAKGIGWIQRVESTALEAAPHVQQLPNRMGEEPATKLVRIGSELRAMVVDLMVHASRETHTTTQ